MKRCTKCNIELQEGINITTPQLSHSSYICKSCRSKIRKELYIKNREYELNYSKEWDKSNREKRNSYTRNWQRRNPESVRKHASLYAKRHPEKVNARTKKWAKNNPGKVNQKIARRRAKKLNATPKWLTEDHLKQIKQLYINAKDLRWEEEMHVDHEIPLQGKKVCGLHVPWNLKIITKEENLIKGNKYV